VNKSAKPRPKTNQELSRRAGLAPPATVQRAKDTQMVGFTNF
jgi:hypothetical protein